jgi:hypothetical protein
LKIKVSSYAEAAKRPIQVDVAFGSLKLCLKIEVLKYAMAFFLSAEQKPAEPREAAS